MANKNIKVYVIRRLLVLPITFLIITMLVFAIYQLAPGEPIDYVLSEEQLLRPDIRDAAMARYGLDKSGPEQYWNWLSKFFTGDWGISYKNDLPVFDLVTEALAFTMLLNLVPFFLVLPISLWLGKKMAVKANSGIDRGVMAFTLLGYAFPSIVLGIFLIWLFADLIPIFPASGMESRELMEIAKHMALPVIALLIGSFAYFQRYVRANMLEVLRENYITTARAKGVDEKVVINKHAFRNTMIPVSTYIVGYIVTGLLGTSFILEYIFSWPGLGRLTIEAAQNQDIYLIMATLVMYTVLGFVVYVIRDIVYAYVDPRVSLR